MQHPEEQPILRPEHSLKLAISSWADTFESWEAALQKTETVTEEELIKIRELDNEIRSVEHYMPGYKKIPWCTDSYNGLTKEERGWQRDKSILALSIATMKHPPLLRIDQFHPIEEDLTPSQKLLAVRLQHSLESGDRHGLIALMRAGEGKSFAIPAVLPLMLAYYTHVDVTSLSPVKRDESFEAFKPVALALGITNCEFDEGGTRIANPAFGAKANAKLNDPQGIIAVMGLNQFRVSFSVRADIIHFFERHPEHLTDLQPKDCARISDEIDASDVDMALERYIISGKQEASEQVIKRYWQVFDLPNDLRTKVRTRKGIPQYSGVIPTSLEDRPSMKIYQEHIDTIKVMLANQQHHGQTDVDSAKRTLQTDGKSTNAVWAASLLRVFMRTYRELSLTSQNPELRRALINPDGVLTTKGEEEVFRRMYGYFTQTPSFELTIPAEWDWTLRSLFPVQVMQATSIALSLDEHYFIDDGHIKVKSEHTGYPRPRNEFTPLVTLALYVKESFSHDVQLPRELHETVDSMSAAEFQQNRYGFELGLTGSGHSVSRFFDAALDIPSTIIPSTHEDKLTVEPIRSFSDRSEKFSWVMSQLEHQWLDTPVTIIAQTQQDTDELYKLIQDSVGGGRKVQLLRAQNANEASTIIDGAGEKNTITVAHGMIGREVSIPVETSLVVVSLSPQIQQRNAEQESRRAARFGKPGKFVQLTDPNDRVWKDLPLDTELVMNMLFPMSRQSLQKAIQHQDTDTIERMLESIRNSQEEVLMEQAIRIRRTSASRAAMRRELAGLPERQRERLKSIWPSLMATLDVAQTNIGFSNTHLDPQLRYNKFTRISYSLFQRLVKLSKKPHFTNRALNTMEKFSTTINTNMEFAPIPTLVPPAITKWFGSFNASRSGIK